MENRYAYYAFISYNHKDSKKAKWIQDSLENFKFPTTLRKDYGSRIPDNLRPIFRDATDLNAGVLEENLQRELLDARYLVVICSPNSAKSEWVNKEVEFFIQNGREDQIIPLIVEGRPDTDDESEQCFVPALRNLKKEILGISIPEIGEEKAVVKIVAKMLCLKFDQLWQRHERRKKQSRRHKILIAAAIPFLLFTSLCLFGLYLDREVVSYYADYVDVGGVPKGIIPLSKEQVAHRYRSYKFVESEMKLKRVEYVNSAGTLRENDMDVFSEYTIEGTRPAAMEIEYHDNGSVSNIIYLNTTQKPFFTIHYPDEKSTLNPEFKSSDKSNAVSLGKEYEKSKINKYSFVRDSNGYVSIVRYQNYAGYDVEDNDCIFGKRFERNELGQIIKEFYLDKDQKTMSIKSGIASIGKKYDNHGNHIETSYFSIDGKLIIGKNGYAKVTWKYDDHDNQIEERYFGTDGMPIMSNYRYAKITRKYDDRGNRIEERYFGIDGMPTIDNIYGYAIIMWKYDNRGNRTEARGFGTDGKPVIYMNGYAKVTWKYDDQDNQIEENYFGIDEKPVISKNGCATVMWKYDERGNRIEGRCFGIDGMSAINDIYGSAKIMWKYDERGNLIEESYFGIDGKPAISKNASAKVTWKYDERGSLIEESYFGIDGTPVISKNGYAKLAMTYDDQGNPTERAYFGADGELVINKDGYAIEVNIYDGHGNLIEQSYVGINGESVISKSGYARYSIIYDKYDDVMSVWFYGVDGKLINIGVPQP